MPRVKKILLWVLVVFAVYAIITSPTQAADIVHTTWDIVVQAVTPHRRLLRRPAQPGDASRWRRLTRSPATGSCGATCSTASTSSPRCTSTGPRSPSRSPPASSASSSPSGWTRFIPASVGHAGRRALVGLDPGRGPGRLEAAGVAARLVRRHRQAADPLLRLGDPQVAMMPLSKVTDMSYNRSLLGRVARLRHFVMESAGQDQALHHVNWVPEPDHTYRAICAQIFGVDDRDRVDLVTGTTTARRRRTPAVRAPVQPAVPGSGPGAGAARRSRPRPAAPATGRPASAIRPAEPGGGRPGRRRRPVPLPEPRPAAPAAAGTPTPARSRSCGRPPIPDRRRA